MTGKVRALINGELRCPTCDDGNGKFRPVDDFNIRAERQHCRASVCRECSNNARRRQREAAKMESVKNGTARKRKFKTGDKAEPANTFANFMIRRLWNNNLNIQEFVA